MTTFRTLNDPSASGTVAWDITDSGQIVENGYIPYSYSHGFLLSGGSDTMLNGPSGATLGVTAQGINNQGQIMPISWKAPVNGDFATASNWSTGTVPGATDDAAITAAGT